MEAIVLLGLALSFSGAQDPLSEEAVQARIDRIRKEDAVVQVLDRNGAPVKGAKVNAVQTKQAFLFGCNAYGLFTHQDPQREALYQKRFTDLFNYATVAFYWGAYEPEPGRTNEAALRKQAEWLKAHGIKVKGHPLVWHEVYPGWAPKDPDAAKALLKKRIDDIVPRFKGLIDIWDVFNEAIASPRFDNGVGNWVKRDGAAEAVGTALEWARKAGPKAFLIYNDFDTSPKCQELDAALVKAKRPVDAFGIQSHMHHADWKLEDVWRICEEFAKIGKPLHWTEATVLSGEHGWMRPRPWPTTPEGEARQADYVPKFYKLLFSHPAVEAITWWDLADGAWQGAPAGLIRADYSPKPAYERLKKLIREEWMTRETLETGADGKCRLRGFLGDYTVVVEAGGKRAEKSFSLKKGNPRPWVVRLP